MQCDQDMHRSASVRRRDQRIGISFVNLFVYLYIWLAADTHLRVYDLCEEGRYVPWDRVVQLLRARQVLVARL